MSPAPATIFPWFEPAHQYLSYSTKESACCVRSETSRRRPGRSGPCLQSWRRSLWLCQPCSGEIKAFLPASPRLLNLWKKGSFSCLENQLLFSTGKSINTQFVTHVQDGISYARCHMVNKSYDQLPDFRGSISGNLQVLFRVVQLGKEVPKSRTLGGKLPSKCN